MLFPESVCLQNNKKFPGASPVPGKMSCIKYTTPLGAIQLAQDTLIEINAGNLMFGIDVNLFYNRSPERLTAFP